MKSLHTQHSAKWGEIHHNTMRNETSRRQRRTLRHLLKVYFIRHPNSFLYIQNICSRLARWQSLGSGLSPQTERGQGRTNGQPAPTCYKTTKPQNPNFLLTLYLIYLSCRFSYDPVPLQMFPYALWIFYPNTTAPFSFSPTIVAWLL